MSETALPTLSFSNPLCPVCLEETDRDDYAYSCDDCGIQWSDSGTEPEWMYAGGQCRSTLTRERGGLSLETDTYRCMKYNGHNTTDHRSSHLLSSWLNCGPGVSEVAR